MKKIFPLILAALTLVGCEEYLDKVPDSSGMTEDDVFTGYLNFRQFEDGMYKDMHDYLSNGDYSFIASLCDEGSAQCDWETLTAYQNGNWLRAYGLGQSLNYYLPWRAWESIRIANISLQKLPLLTNATTQQKNELKGQAHFMRAWYYYEFLKRFGGMPYITKPLGGADNFALPRLSYDETAHMIAADCDSAMALLPTSWDNANLGRPTKGAAMALKAGTLIFNASPLNNTTSEASKWEEAGKAAWDLIKFAEETGTYKLMDCNSTDKVKYRTPAGDQTIEFAGGYDSIFNYLPTNDEIIWEYWSQMENSERYTTFAVPGLSKYNIIQGYSPSQNLVDMYETLNGLAIGDDQTFSEQNPYVDRDPRFYHSILFNKERWTSKSDYFLSLDNGGTERQNLKQYSRTGYLARKFWINGIDLNSTSVHPISHCIYFRYAEVLMWYAEAANEIGGPNHKIDGANLTAVEAVNRVRARVHMPGVQSRYLSGKDSFRERIKNERAIEFFLEGKRFFDLARWLDASKVKHKEILAIDIAADPSKPTGYVFSRNPIPVVTLTFDQKHYRWPINLKDATMFKEFEQNPGW